jgi:hypothetical protein
MVRRIAQAFASLRVQLTTGVPPPRPRRQLPPLTPSQSRYRAFLTRPQWRLAPDDAA